MSNEDTEDRGPDPKNDKDEVLVPPPPGFTEEKREEFLTEVRQGMRPGAAAEYVGCNRRDILEFIEMDVDFAKEVHFAEIEATELVEEALFQAAASGNVSAARVWLEMRGKMPQKAPPSKTESVGGQPPSAAPVPSAGSDDPFADLDNVVNFKR